jgi:uncharacterized protein (DUF433 family)
VAKLNPRLAPAYTVAEAARYLRIPLPTVRSWVIGRDYPRRSGTARFRPVVVRPKDSCHRLSFRNLVELAALQGLMRRIKWEGRLPVRFFPPVPNRPEERSVMLDPTVSFGRPVLARLGVTTSVIVDRINAGEEPAAVAKDYGATQDEIMDALAYERAA